MWSTELTAPKRGESGLLELTREAYGQFQAKVVREGWIYERFAEYFLSGIDNTDAIDAASRNEHQRNVSTVTTLLLKRMDLVEDYFTRNRLKNDELREIIHLLNTTQAKSDRASSFEKSTDDDSKSSPHTLYPCLHHEEYIALAACCNRVKMFSKDITTKELVSLLNGTMSNPLYSANNRLLAYFLWGLSFRKLITDTWQSILSEWGMIYSSSAKSPLNRSDFSSALYSITSIIGTGRPSKYNDVDDTLDEVERRNYRNRRYFK